MSSGHKFELVDVVEFGCNLRAEEPSGTTWGDSPGVNVLGVRPHEVGEGTFVGNLHSAVDEADLIKSLDLWGETTVDAEDFTFDDGADAEVIEHFSAVFPGVDVSVFTHGLFVEAVNGGHTSGLVVASEKGDAVGPLQLQTEQELEGLNGVVAAIDKVTHEDVAGIRNLTTFFKKLEKVVELTVDVATDSDGSADWLDIALFDKDLLDLLAKDAKVSFGQDSSVLDSSEPGVDVRFSGHFVVWSNFLVASALCMRTNFIY